MYIYIYIYIYTIHPAVRLSSHPSIHSFICPAIHLASCLSCLPVLYIQSLSLSLSLSIPLSLPLSLPLSPSLSPSPSHNGGGGQRGEGAVEVVAEAGARARAGLDEASIQWASNIIHVRNLLGWLRLGWLKIDLIASKYV